MPPEARSEVRRLGGHDVVCLGEVLVDFLPNRRGRQVREVESWQACLGGAPANVAVGVARLGGASALVGVTGADEFGARLVAQLSDEGVDVRWLRQSKEGRTGLGFVSVTAAGERSFIFYRHRAAETFFDARDTSAAAGALRRARVLHCGTNSLVQAGARRAVLAAVRQSRAAGQITSCDPNLRLHLWRRPATLRSLLWSVLPQCAVVKLAEDELSFVTDTRDVGTALRRLELAGVALVVVTRGPKGAVLRFRGLTIEVPSPAVKVVDTTGAGDGFMAGLLFGLTRHCASRADLEALDPGTAKRAARLGCLVASHVVQRLGAVAGLPRRRALPAWARARGPAR